MLGFFNFPVISIQSSGKDRQEITTSSKLSTKFLLGWLVCLANSLHSCTHYFLKLSIWFLKLFQNFQNYLKKSSLLKLTHVNRFFNHKPLSPQETPILIISLFHRIFDFTIKSEAKNWKPTSIFIMVRWLSGRGLPTVLVLLFLQVQSTQQTSHPSCCASTKQLLYNLVDTPGVWVMCHGLWLVSASVHLCLGLVPWVPHESFSWIHEWSISVFAWIHELSMDAFL